MTMITHPHPTHPELPPERVGAIAYFAAVAGPACVAVERMRARKAAA